MSQSPGRRPSEALRITIAFIVSCAFLMQGIDSTLLTVTIPTLARSLDVDPLSLHLAITAYLLSLAVFMPVSGWFADRFGARNVFIWSLVVFTVGSIFCGMAPNLEILVAARVVQGLGGAMMTPVGRLIVLRTFGPGRTLDAMTYLTLPVLIGPLLGPLLGATIISFTSWRWIFYVNVPVCAITILLALVFIDRDEKVTERARFDFGGFVVAGICLLLFQLGVETLGERSAGLWVTPALFAGSVAVFLFYLWHARRVENPALELSLFATRPFAVGVIAGGIGRVGLNSTSFLLPLMLQLGFGLPPLHAAAYSAISVVGSVGAKPFLRRCLRTFGFAGTISALVIGGSALMAGMSLFARGVPIMFLVLYVIVLGAIRTMHFNSVNTLTYSRVPDRLLSRSVATGGVFQQLSMGLGVSLSAAVLSMIVPEGGIPTLTDFSIAYLVMAAIPLLSIPVLLMLKEKQRGEEDAAAKAV
ncbi:MAG TPA: MFS transporter [Devosiaceae bacterium]|jgi:EmrB/QacA subfamily drug resistance transporter